MKNSNITVIIPVYNSERYLHKCINSVRQQTYTNLEIILVNDGSTDNSLKICEEFSELDKRIKIINQSNQGVASARNSGLDVAIGQYIGFVDSDDFIASNMYEKLLKNIISHQADVVECGYFTCNTQYKNVKPFKLKESIIEGEFECSCAYLNHENTTNYNVNKLYKSSLFEELRYPKYRYSEDYWLNTHIYYNCKKKVTIEECLYYYVQNDESAVNKKFDYIKRIDTIKAAQDVYNFHSQRYAEFCPLIASYICTYALKFYYELKKDNENNQIYLKELTNIFNKYYMEVKLSKTNELSILLKIYMIAFKVNPSLFYLLRKISMKLK